MNEYFKKHKFPEELNNMTIEDLEVLSFEIRDFLIESVSKTGGHLASNLGAVELTLALFKIFDQPRDKIIWDVGHQTYVHKILTGRADKFNSLRQLDGMSGFPKKCESEYDIFDVGHSSTSISLGLGMAAARDLAKEDYHVVSVIGDGAMTGGVAFEALNNIVNVKSKIIVVLNDNGMSISPNTGGISSYLGKMRGSRKYANFKSNVKKNLKKLPYGISQGVEKGMKNAKDTIKFAVIDEGILFEEFGLKYFGPIDGHNLEELCETMQMAKEAKGPVLVHVITKKGKGYSIAENTPSKFHGVSPFDPETGDPVVTSCDKSYSAVMGDKLVDLANSHNDVVAISAAMIDGTGLDKFAKRFPRRMFDVGIAEGHAVTFAGGLSRAGMKPFVPVYSTFLQRAYDNIIQDICLQNLPAVLCLDRAGIVGADGETHHGIFDLSYLGTMPNLTVMAPKDGPELEKMMELAYEMNTPCAIRYPRGAAPFINDAPVKLGQAEPLVEGDKAAIWAIGNMVDTALKAAELLKENNINISVYNARFLKPIDKEAILKSAEKHQIIFTIEDNISSGGLGETIDAILVNENTRLINLCWPDKFIEQGSQSQLYERYGLDFRSVAERIKKELER